MRKKNIILSVFNIFLCIIKNVKLYIFIIYVINIIIICAPEVKYMPYVLLFSYIIIHYVIMSINVFSNFNTILVRLNFIFIYDIHYTYYQDPLLSNIVIQSAKSSLFGGLSFFLLKGLSEIVYKQ